MNTVDHPRSLGREKPPNFDHVAKYPFSAIAAAPAPPMGAVEVAFPRPSFCPTDQNGKGACVGFGDTTALSVALLAANKGEHQFDPWALWHAAKVLDGTGNPDDDRGTFVHCALQALRDQGPTPIGASAPDPSMKISAFHWCQSVDDIRTAFAQSSPVVAGTDWFTEFDHESPYVGNVASFQGDEWVAENGQVTTLRGGHCYVFRACSDSRQACLIENSWDGAFAPAWIPYSLIGGKLEQDGAEYGVIVL